MCVCVCVCVYVCVCVCVCELCVCVVGWCKPCSPLGAVMSTFPAATNATTVTIRAQSTTKIHLEPECWEEENTNDK